MTLEDATKEAKRVGLIVRLKSTATPPTKATKDATLVGKMLVEWQSVANDETVPKGTVIEVTQVRYGAARPLPPAPGPNPADKVRVPKLTQMTLEDATKEAKR